MYPGIMRTALRAMKEKLDEALSPRPSSNVGIHD